MTTGGRAVLALALAFLAVDAPGASAQGPGGVLYLPASAGIRTGYDFQANAWSAGGRVMASLAPMFALVPSADAFFLGNRSAWQVNLDAALMPEAGGPIYGGGGIALGDRDPAPNTTALGETRAHINLFVGVHARGRTRPYLEMRWTSLSHGPALHLVFGLDVSLAGGL